MTFFRKDDGGVCLGKLNFSATRRIELLCGLSRQINRLIRLPDVPFAVKSFTTLDADHADDAQGLSLTANVATRKSSTHTKYLVGFSHPRSVRLQLQEILRARSAIIFVRSKLDGQCKDVTSCTFGKMSWFVISETNIQKRYRVLLMCLRSRNSILIPR